MAVLSANLLRQVIVLRLLHLGRHRRSRTQAWRPAECCATAADRACVGEEQQQAPCSAPWQDSSCRQVVGVLEAPAVAANGMRHAIRRWRVAHRAPHKPAPPASQRACKHNATSLACTMRRLAAGRAGAWWLRPSPPPPCRPRTDPCDPVRHPAPCSAPACRPSRRHLAAAARAGRGWWWWRRSACRRSSK